MKKCFIMVLALVFLLGSLTVVFAKSDSMEQAYKPVLKLEVVTADSATESAKANVKYIARLGNIAALPSQTPIMIDFYTGNPFLTVFPNQYLGSAPVNEKGVAELKVFQKPGVYAGGGIWAKTPWGPIFSNVVVYKVAPVKPELSLKVQVSDASESVLGNVTYLAKLSFYLTPKPAGTSAPVIQPPVKTPKIDFYTGSQCKLFPGKYVGSAYVDKNGMAKLTFLQKPGLYAGGAIWAKTPWGKIMSNVVFYKIPKPVGPVIAMNR
jgi:hypothetical protein